MGLGSFYQKSIKFSIYFINKFWLFLFCLSGLLYQSKDLFNGYMNGSTVASIRVKRVLMDNLPAVTICLPGISFVKSVENNPEYLGLYKNYTNYIDQLISAKHGKPVKMIETKELIKVIYRQFLEEFNRLNVTALNILNNHSTTFDRFLAQIYGFVNETSDSPTTFSSEENIFGFKIIESIYHDYDGTNVKCFTFFSQLCEASRKFKAHLRYVHIQFKLSYKMLPLNLLDTEFITVKIHSPNSFLDISEETNKLNPNKIYVLSYNQISTKLLDSRYDTNCFGYDLDYKFANFNMRSDCIASCIQKRISELCNLTGIVSTGYFLRRATLENEEYQDQYFAPTDSCQVLSNAKSKFVCEQKCKSDCRFKYFSFEKGYEVKDYWKQRNEFNLVISHNSKPDVTIIYVPQTTFLSLVCSFGGLSGMWLGLSFLTIFDNLFKRLIKKYGIVRVFNQNVTTINFFSKSKKVQIQNSIHRIN